jgi:hypothetical protein
METTMSDERTMTEARTRMTRLSVGLAAKLGPQEAAGVLAGAAIGVLTTAFGPEHAATFFRELADAIELGDDPVGNA